MHLRKLVGKAYEIELGRCLDTLFEQYQQWKEQEITVWELEEKIHEFHNRRARELYKAYSFGDLAFSVAFGIHSGVIDISEVEQTCLSEVKKKLEYLESDT